MTVTAYRITKREFARAIWSGIGAREYGGRWNSKGLAVVYASESRALAAMEQLVRLIKPRALSGYVVASITFSESQLLRVDEASLPRGWDSAVAPPPLRKFGDDWVGLARSPLLAVPSAIIRGEWNFLINPAHAEFGRLKKSRVRPFVYDNRLG